jgi:acetyltransferase
VLRVNYALGLTPLALAAIVTHRDHVQEQQDMDLPLAPPFPDGDGRATIASRSGRTVAVRNIVPADDALLVDLYYRLSPKTQQLRFFCHNRLEAIVQREARRLASIDVSRQAALIATAIEDDGERAIGVARLACEADEPAVAEFAIVLRDDYQRDGIGGQLLQLLVLAARARGVTTLRVVWMAENRAVQRLIQRSRLQHTSTTHQGETTTLFALTDRT